MQDLTTGPITRHLLKTTGFMLVTMLFQTLYFLIDLYWVGRLGTAAVAAVGIAGNLTFIVLALTQMLGVGTTAVISHAVGRKAASEAVMLFNQAQVLAMVTGALFLVVGLVTRLPYARGMAADARTAELAAQYLAWFVPAMALQFGLVAMSAALRAIGNFKTGMVVGTVTVILNMILAPFLIFGWGTGHPLGVAGAAIASLVAIVVGLVWLTAYFRKVGSFLQFDPSAWRPRPAIWKQMLGIGLPSICFQIAGRGRQALGSNCRKEPTFRKYAVSHTSPTTIATSEAMAAPATPSGWPVPQPKMRNGARIMLRMTVTVPTTMPVLKLPMARRAALIATRPNCSAMAGTNQARYCAASSAGRAAAALAPA